MNKTIKEALELINSLKRELVYIEGVDIIVCPPYTALSDASEILMDSNIKLGAQDVYWEHSGAFTGEVSALMLKDVGCEYVILGHSERRKYFFETDEAVNKKIKTSLSVGLTPICCVGETLDEREEEKTFDIIERQLQGALKGLSQEDMSRLIIAY
ncbi:MAG: triose-phosphate isomerase, partial [Candidatus Omnitrophica bacterium]|nr:triose-phosphate isomerase [Candidatus Omnitrophota bacterium]